MGLKGGAGGRSKQGRRKLAWTAVFLAVAAAEGVLVGMLDLTGSALRTPSTAADEAVPYYLATERTPPPKPKDLAAERRPPRKRKPAVSPPPGLPSPPAPSVSPPAPAASPSAAATPPTSDYGRWTVAPGAWPEAGRGGIAMSVCDPANLANLPADARKACTEKLKRASVAGPPAPSGAAPDWKEHNLLTSCNERKNEPAHKWLLDHCSPVGSTGVGFTLKYKF